MKNHRFLWLRNRTTDNRKCEKARNIKEKRTIEMFNTVSKPPAALRSSASADRRSLQIQSKKAVSRETAFFFSKLKSISGYAKRYARKTSAAMTMMTMTGTSGFI